MHPKNNSLSTVSVFSFPKGRYMKALSLFGKLRMGLAKVPSLRFSKPMGCGRGAVFSLLPDWSRYAVLMVWEDADAAHQFINHNDNWKQFVNLSQEEQHYSLQPFHLKGTWAGQQPFEIQERDASTATLPVAIITRAELKPWLIRGFWKHAEMATDAVITAPGMQYSLGMGELPIIRQATFSVWDSEEDMKAYAYKKGAHTAAMQHKKKWFGEEMYVRFSVLNKVENYEQLL